MWWERKSNKERRHKKAMTKASQEVFDPFFFSLFFFFFPQMQECLQLHHRYQKKKKEKEKQASKQTVKRKTVLPAGGYSIYCFPCFDGVVLCVFFFSICLQLSFFFFLPLYQSSLLELLFSISGFFVCLFFPPFFCMWRKKNEFSFGVLSTTRKKKKREGKKKKKGV